MTTIVARRRGRSVNRREDQVDCVAVVTICCLIAGLAALVWFLLKPYTGPQYLYLNGNDTHPIIDYVQPGTTNGDGDSSTDPTSSSIPDFLNSTELGPHVVEFYAPWCPHCRRFKPNYVNLARKVQSSGPGKDVQFYAVSCTANRNVCLQEQIRSFPTIKFFHAGNRTGEVWWNHRMTADDVLERLMLIPAKVKDWQQQQPLRKEPTAAAQRKAKSSHTVSAVPASYFPERSKTEIFSDAALSFDFALRNNIFMSFNPLSSDQKTTLQNWMKLLQHTIPPQMHSVHDQIEAILESFDSISQDHTALEEAIRDIKPSTDRWSASCTRGSEYAGYTCGLWELFHIVTVGVAEWNNDKIQKGENLDTIPAAYAASVIRDYIEHFFACEVCRENFIQSYDGCAFDRCTRLSDGQSQISAYTWKDLGLWLWETHNDVNIRLLRERTEREGGQNPDEAQSLSVRWPSDMNCPDCWNVDGTFNSDEVYRHLRTEYWPSDELNAEQRGKEVHLGITSDGEMFSFKLLSLQSGALVSVAIFLVCALWWIVRRQNKERSGRHKKNDFSRYSVLPL